MKSCWCGNQALERFSPHYARCPNCQTLVSQDWSTQNLSSVKNDAEDFYGKNYWLSHQAQDLGFPDITSRAVMDLPERCLYWLRTLLKYKLPPAKTLELGSAHGGSVAMFKWAGFDAAGLELSPWVVDFSRQTFDIPILLGPIEDQAIEPASLDVISLMDVFEHLPDPTRTMQHCLTLLKPDGLLLIQTPLFLETKTYELMQEEDNRFLEQLKHDEHLFLFSQQALRRFFRRLGAHQLIFEPAIFAHYDMFVVVSRCDLPVHCTADVCEALSATAGGRLIRALLDLDDQMRQAHRLSDARQRDLQLQVQALHQQFATQQANHTTQAEALHQCYTALEAEYDAQRREIEHQRQEMMQLEANKRHWKRMAHDMQSQVKTLQQRHVALEAEHAAQDQVIERQRQSLTQFQDETSRLHQHMQDMHEQLQAMTQAHTGLQGRFEALTKDHEHLGMQLHLAQDQLHIAQRTRVYRLLRRLGRWKFLESNLPTSPDS